MALIDETARSAEPAPHEPETAPPAATVALAIVGGALAAIVVTNVIDQVWWTPRALTYGLVLAVLLPVAAVAPRRSPLVLAALGGAWFGLIGLYALAKGVQAGIPVDRAVGAAAYFDTPYVPAQLASGVALLLAFGAAAAVRHRRGPAAVPPPAEAPGGRGPWIVALVTAVIAAALLPDPWARLSPAALAPIPFQWDAGNTLTWDWMLEGGLKPVRDYFFPYGHASVFAATPWGPAWHWLSQVLLLGVTAWAFWRLANRSVARTLVAVGLVGLLLYGQPVADRYYCGVLMGIVYAAIGPAAHRRPGFGHLLLAVVTLYTGWYEPDVLVMGVAAMVFVALGELVAGRIRLAPREAVRRLVVDAAPLATIALVPVIWALEGTFDENRRFWLAVRAISAASARDEDRYSPLAKLEVAVTPTTISVLLPLLLLVGGLALARVRTREARSASLLFLIGAAACEVLLAKHLVRDVTTQVAVLGLTIVIPAAALLWSRQNVWLAALIGVFAGLTFGYFQQTRAVSNVFAAAFAAPGHALDSLRLPGRYAEVSQAERARFSPTRFDTWTDARIAENLQALRNGDPNRRFAVLGDSPMLYVLLQQLPPYHVELYDASRIEEQEVYVDELRKLDPEFIVFRRDQAQDEVPMEVRSPLIFDYIVRNYVPRRRGDVWDILARRGEAPIAVDFWRTRLGALNLGAVPRHSRADSAPACTGGPDCHLYAMLRGHTDSEHERVWLRVTGADGQAFAAAVDVWSHDDSYPVRLDRLWFWPLVGPSPRVEVQRPAGWTAKVEGRQTGDDLY